MKIIDLLNKIANGEMEEAVFYINGDFFYDLIVINENLYVINTRTKQLELLETKYISRFIRDNVELIRLDKEVETIEEEKKIPEKISLEIDKFEDSYYDTALIKVAGKIDELIDYLDYLKSKGDE